MPENRTATLGRRPANRRELILDAAESLFTSRGFADVSMSDIAEAVGVRPSALYRHFSGKETLLDAAVMGALERFDRVLDVRREEPVSRSQFLAAIAEFSAQHRSAALLWEREARHVPTTYELVATRLSEIRGIFVRAVYPVGELTTPRRLAGRMALAILLSPAFHRVPFGSRASRKALVGAAGAVLDASLVEVPVVASTATTEFGAPAGLSRATKREQVLQAALRIFAEQTYANAGMDQIAAAVGLTAPSLYNYFAGKAEILQIALHRGNGYLQVTLDEVLRDATDERAALRSLTSVYVSFALRHPGLMDALLTQINSLRDDSNTFVEAQREYVGEWAALHVAACRDLSPSDSLLAVHAALAAVNEIARDRWLRASAGAEETATRYAVAALRM